MGAREFGQWLVFMHEEGLGPAAEQHRWAEMMAALWNGPMQRKGGGNWRAGEFLPRPWRPVEPPKPATGANARAFLARLKKQ